MCVCSVRVAHLCRVHAQIFTDLKKDVSVEVEIQQSIGAEEVTFGDATSSSGGALSPDESLASPSAAATSAQARVLTQADHGQHEFQDTHAFTQEHMRVRVVEQFPAEYWAEVKAAVAAKTKSKKAKTESAAHPQDEL